MVRALVLLLDEQSGYTEAHRLFRRGCDLGSQAACGELSDGVVVTP